MITNYTDLQTTILSWTSQETVSEFVDEVPTFIQLGEAELFNTLRAFEMIQHEKKDLTAEYHALPTGYLAAEEMAKVSTDNSGRETENVMIYLEPDNFRRQQSGVAGEYYTIMNGQLRFKDKPTGTESPPLKYDFSYYGRFTNLSGAAPTNIILTLYPQAYLWASLVQAESWLVNDPRIAVWKTQLADTVDKINLISEQRRGVMSVGPAY